MTTQALKDTFQQNHQELSDFIAALDEAQFTRSANGKWTAGQQLGHVCLCLAPISQALASKDFIRKQFGVTDRPNRQYQEVVDAYKAALAAGGSAPGRFLPAAIGREQLPGLVEDMQQALQTIVQHLDGYSDPELDTMQLPHPLLGNMTIRELMYLMTYHATHHLGQTKQNLVV